MNYVLITDESTVDTYPYSIAQLRVDNPNTSFPASVPSSMLLNYNVHPVTIEPEPEYNEVTQKVIHNSQPTLVNGVWTLSWQVVSLFEEYVDGEGNTITVEQQSNDANAKATELLSAQRRAERDELLKATDHYGLADFTLTSEMSSYRQALRDVPQQAGFPNTINWPTKPQG